MPPRQSLRHEKYSKVFWFDCAISFILLHSDAPRTYKLRNKQKRRLANGANGQDFSRGSEIAGKEMIGQPM